MKKHILSIILYSIVSNLIFAQTSNLGDPIIFKEKVSKTKIFFQTPFVDNSQEILLEKSRSTASNDKMYRFGKEHSVSINVFESAEKTVLPNGDLLYQFGIECKNAVSINLIFDKFELAQGVNVYLVDPIKRKFDGAYTFLNNNSSKMLGTELIYAEKAIIEIVVPKEKEGLSSLNIGTIIHGYRSLNDMAKSLNSSGTCEIDVNCPLGQGWENQRNSVAMMVSGGGFCTGSLVNNTSGVIIPYFLSANHCGTTPGAWVFRFRWESPAGQADCGTSAPSVDGPTTMNVNGGILRASNATSDFTLTELNQAPDPTWGIYYNGWDRTDIAATQLTGIHHPSGDIKKISRDNSTAVSSAFNSGTPDSHWRVPSWDEGVTEGGSSGSPLFNQNHRTIGQLHGGASSCGASPSNLNDDYGKFFLSWTGGGTSGTRLSDWLDPGNIAPTFIDGIDPSIPNYSVDGGVSNPIINYATLCGGDLTPQIDIYNPGVNTLTSATIQYGFDGATDLTYNWTGSLINLASETITLPTLTLGGGNHTFKAIFINTTATDQNAENDTLNSTFTTIENGEIITVNLTINCYASEISWEITDTFSQTVFASGLGYDDSTLIPIIDSVCLAEECYLFKIHDSFGDGLSGSASLPCDNGNYILRDASNNVLSQLLPVDANFGLSKNSKFCLGDANIEEFSSPQQIKIFPNPANATVTISSSDNKVNSIEIMTITGQKVYENHLIISSISIDVTPFSKGIYLVKLVTENGIGIEQLIVR